VDEHREVSWCGPSPRRRPERSELGSRLRHRPPKRPLPADATAATPRCRHEAAPSSCQHACAGRLPPRRRPVSPPSRLRRETVDERTPTLAQPSVSAWRVVNGPGSIRDGDVRGGGGGGGELAGIRAAVARGGRRWSGRPRAGCGTLRLPGAGIRGARLGRAALAMEPGFRGQGDSEASISSAEGSSGTGRRSAAVLKRRGRRWRPPASASQSSTAQRMPDRPGSSVHGRRSRRRVAERPARPARRMPAAHARRPAGRARDLPGPTRA